MTGENSIVVTSLAPRFSRVDKDGRDIGPEYREACVASWRRISNQIYTVNSAKESIDLPGIKRLHVHRDASQETGRPLPYLQDVIDSALSCNAEKILIVNGDICLYDPNAFSGIRPGVAVVFKRMDVDDLRSIGKLHVYGYDAFAIHRDDLTGLACGGIFGAPWYDYHLPMRLLERGVEMKISLTAAHLQHPLNWSWPLWERLGWQFAQTVPNFMPPFWRASRMAQMSRKPRMLYDLTRRIHTHIDIRANWNGAFPTILNAGVEPCRRDGAPNKKIVVCICTHSSNELLNRALNSLRTAWFPKNAELVIVDSNPGNAKTAVEGRQFPIPLHYVPEPRPGRAHARNRGVAAAESLGADFVSFIDDNNVPQPDWLFNLLVEQESSGSDLVFGSWHYSNGLPKWLRSVPEFESPQMSTKQEYGVPLPKNIAACNVLVRLSVLTAVPFCPDFTPGEDMDFFVRAAKSGASFAISRESVVNRSFESGRITAIGLLRMAHKCSVMNTAVAKRHASDLELKRRRRKARKMLLRSLVLAPGSAIFYPANTMGFLCRAASAVGTLRSLP